MMASKIQDDESMMDRFAEFAQLYMDGKMSAGDEEESGDEGGDPDTVKTAEDGENDREKKTQTISAREDDDDDDDNDDDDDEVYEDEEEDDEELCDCPSCVEERRIAEMTEAVQVDCICWVFAVCPAKFHSVSSTPYSCFFFKGESVPTRV
jgi:hypothetical protein